jgi:pimeloyl-ACP methyl ester carboxylesterase
MKETSHLFGQTTHLVGTITHTDSSQAASSIGVILLNAGVIGRIGPHRMNVKLARTLASAGYPCLRFDLAGLGDSPRSSGNLPYEKQAVADIQAAMDHLQAHTQATSFALIGFCSGADNGYATALQDPRLNGLVLFDPYAYPTPITHLLRMRARLKNISLIQAGSAWLRRRWRTWRHPSPRQPDNEPRTASSSRLIPPRSVFAQGLIKLQLRGVKLYLVHSGSMLYTYNHDWQYRLTFWRWPSLQKLRCEYLPQVDHALGECRAQKLLTDRILMWMKQVFPATPK